MFLRHKEVPHPFGPAINSFWYLICNKIFGYCKRPEELAILISGLLLRMCGLFIHHYFGPLLRMARVWSSVHSFTHIRHFEVSRETGSRWVFKCIVGLFWATYFQHGGKFIPQNSPTIHFHNHLDPVSRATSKWRIWSRTFWTFITWNIRKACYSITFSYY